MAACEYLAPLQSTWVPMNIRVRYIAVTIPPSHPAKVTGASMFVAPRGAGKPEIAILPGMRERYSPLGPANIHESAESFQRLCRRVLLGLPRQPKLLLSEANHLDLDNHVLVIAAHRVAHKAHRDILPDLYPLRLLVQPEHEVRREMG